MHQADVVGDNISSTEDNNSLPVHDYQDQVGACHEITTRGMIDSPRTSEKWTKWRIKNEDNITKKDDLGINDTTLEIENDAPAKINNDVKKFVKTT